MGIMRLLPSHGGGRVIHKASTTSYQIDIILNVLCIENPLYVLQLMFVVAGNSSVR